MDITLRRAVKRDLPEIARMMNELGAYHMALKPELCRAEMRPRPARALYKHLLKPKDRRVYLAVDAEGRARGFLHLLLSRREGNPVLPDCRTVFIEDIYVEERLRGKGIGRLLMQKAREEAKAYGAEALELNVWEYNEDARGFYEREGFGTWQRRIRAACGEQSAAPRTPET